MHARSVRFTLAKQSIIQLAFKEGVGILEANRKLSRWVWLGQRGIERSYGIEASTAVGSVMASYNSGRRDANTVVS